MASGIRTYPASEASRDIWKSINSLTQRNISEGSLPYLQDNPLPQDMNLVNGSHLSDIGRIELELAGSLAGAKSLEWVFGADAEIIGLELKSPNDGPVVISKNLDRGGKSGSGIDCQNAYLLDQFTDESKTRLFDPNLTQILSGVTDENTQSKLKTIVHNIIKNMDEYHRGERELPLIRQKRTNLKNNISNDLLQQKIREKTQDLTSGYNTSQKVVFDHLQNYYLKQLTGLSTYNLSNEQRDKISKSFKELSMVDTPRLAEVLASSFLLSDRKTHYEFEQEQIYTLEDKSKKRDTLVPQAAKMRFGRKTQEKKKDKLRDRDRTLRPQHSRGGV